MGYIFILIAISYMIPGTIAYFKGRSFIVFLLLSIIVTPIVGIILAMWIKPRQRIVKPAVVTKS